MTVRSLTLGVFVVVLQVHTIFGQNCVSGPPDYLCPGIPTSLEVYLQHESYCNRFYRCNEGKAVEGRCPSGLYFNPKENLCCPEHDLCYRSSVCSLVVPGCERCAKDFVRGGVTPQDFYVCNCDGSGVPQRCGWGIDSVSKKNLTLSFINGRCENPDATLSAAKGYTGDKNGDGDDSTLEELLKKVQDLLSKTLGGGGGDGGDGGGGDQGLLDPVIDGLTGGGNGGGGQGGDDQGLLDPVIDGLTGSGGSGGSGGGGDQGLLDPVVDGLLGSGGTTTAAPGGGWPTTTAAAREAAADAAAAACTTTTTVTTTYPA
ncbi:circumsporozoite protein-like [Wyeomyia smithii]|uniref:circumsporozoite protein-like n=1 Tax=Wyeomyia smithii TaxID=174621 RepID=UPI0024680BBE|nr:circumsporozoite protein-like [Wyeomyia smithii]XP_055536189.1 circumsporozoite protein-like [Wyeomyia smithii]